ncbi:hypothetical protein T492DRAFT_879801 [Pavlovales sp. CCMP2436]|nr:hypothetical protein T492DRAFT_879801 [Pavlovales sp. CCMP2436]|mmetsp:Transcript_16893/g.43174  ORF Transcript_16893/g.43174 Transcript_16893/m.43174 type:complete len:106 (-) Transcript_16893:561-878(-)
MDTAEGFWWALVELGGFIVLIACARLAAVMEGAQDGARPSECEGLLGSGSPASSDGPGDERAAPRSERPEGLAAISANCWPARRERGAPLPRQPVFDTDPESLDE